MDQVLYDQIGVSTTKFPVTSSFSLQPTEKEGQLQNWASIWSNFQKQRKDPIMPQTFLDEMQ